MATIVALLRSVGACACLAVFASGSAWTSDRHAVAWRPLISAIRGRSHTPLPAAQRVFEAQLDSLVAAFDTLTAGIDGGRTIDAQRAFRRTRTAYKRVEGLLAYYAPDVVTLLEGPLETEGEDDLQPRPYNTPGAFPMIESAIFPRVVDSTRATLRARIHAMRERVAVLRSLTGTLEVEEAAVFDAARAEIARVSTLDIAGFDSDRQDDALLDAAAALDGVRATLVPPDTPESDRAGGPTARYAKPRATCAGMPPSSGWTGSPSSPDIACPRRMPWRRFARRGRLSVRHACTCGAPMRHQCTTAARSTRRPTQPATPFR